MLTHSRILQPLPILALTEEVGEKPIGFRRGIHVEVVESVREQSVGSTDSVEVPELSLEAHEVAG